MYDNTSDEQLTNTQARPGDRTLLNGLSAACLAAALVTGFGIGAQQEAHAQLATSEGIPIYDAYYTGGSALFQIPSTQVSSGNYAFVLLTSPSIASTLIGKPFTTALSGPSFFGNFPGANEADIVNGILSLPGGSYPSYNFYDFTYFLAYADSFPNITSTYVATAVEFNNTGKNIGTVTLPSSFSADSQLAAFGLVALPNSVPEPGSVMTLVAGGGVFTTALLRRRRARNAKRA